MVGYQRCISESFRCYNCETPGRINRATAQSDWGGSLAYLAGYLPQIGQII
jgi:hypothetical protein